jgi:hypothetical protein
MNTNHDIAVSWGVTGLLGTIGYRVVKTDDHSTIIARTTAGVREFPAGSGNYDKANVVWDNTVDATVYWDAGDPQDTMQQYFPATGLEIPTVDYPDGPTCDLFTYAEFIRRFGLKNIALASNKDNAKANEPDLDSVQQAFDHCVSEVYDALRGGIYAVPLVFTTADGTAPHGIKDPAMVIAFAYLYESRGWEDKNRVGNKHERNVQMAYNRLGWIKSGLKQIEAQVGSGITLAATAVSREDVLQDRINNPTTVSLPDGCVAVSRPDSLPGME